MSRSLRVKNPATHDCLDWIFVDTDVLKDVSISKRAPTKGTNADLTDTKGEHTAGEFSESQEEEGIHAALPGSSAGASNIPAASQSQGHGGQTMKTIHRIPGSEILERSSLTANHQENIGKENEAIPPLALAHRTATRDEIATSGDEPVVRLILRVQPNRRVMGIMEVLPGFDKDDLRKWISGCTGAASIATEAIHFKIPKLAPDGDLPYTRLTMRRRYQEFNVLKGKLQGWLETGRPAEIGVWVCLKKGTDGKLLASAMKKASQHGELGSDREDRGLGPNTE